MDDPFRPDPLHLLACPKRVRVLFGGAFVADSDRALLLREDGHLPVYYLPREDVRAEHLERSDRTTHCPRKGDAVYWHLKVGDKVAEDAVWSYPEPLPDAPEELAGHVAFYWKKVDAWFEEDEQVYVHPRDPFKRVDALRSSRHVKIELGGEVVAESRRPVLLFETGLRTRYYLPKTDVRLDLLVPSATQTRCPYKGTADYYSVRVGDRTWEDVVWTYRHPTPACVAVEGLVCFYDEKVDAVYVDGDRI